MRGVRSSDDSQVVSVGVNRVKIGKRVRYGEKESFVGLHTTLCSIVRS